MVEEFENHNFGTIDDIRSSLVLGSMLYYVLNHITIEAEIAPFASTKRDILSKHLENVKNGCLLLLHRVFSFV